MDFSPRLSLPYLMPNQAQKHVTMNESLLRLDALVNCTAQSHTAPVPPSPSAGDVYLVPIDENHGAWSLASPGDIAVFRDGGWAFLTPLQGWQCYVASLDEVLLFDGTAWRRPTMLGINTSPDATTNLLSQAKPACLAITGKITR